MSFEICRVTGKQIILWVGYDAGCVNFLLRRNFMIDADVVRTKLHIIVSVFMFPTTI